LSNSDVIEKEVTALTGSTVGNTFKKNRSQQKPKLPTVFLGVLAKIPFTKY